MNGRLLLHILIVALLTIFLGSWAAIVGFLVGYLKKSLFIAIMVSVLLSLVIGLFMVLTNPMTFFSLLFGANPFAGLVWDILFSIALGGVGWILGKKSLEGRRRGVSSIGGLFLFFGLFAIIFFVGLTSLSTTAGSDSVGLLEVTPPITLVAIGLVALFYIMFLKKGRKR